MKILQEETKAASGIFTYSPFTNQCGRYFTIPYRSFMSKFTVKKAFSDRSAFTDPE